MNYIYSYIRIAYIYIYIMLLYLWDFLWSPHPTWSSFDGDHLAKGGFHYGSPPSRCNNHWDFLSFHWDEKQSGWLALEFLPLK